jgi:hypothetical protein
MSKRVKISRADSDDPTLIERATTCMSARRTSIFKDFITGTQISKRRDRDQRWSLLMLDPLILYIFAGCAVILALGMASGDFS